MVKGLGVDIIEIRRIANAIEKNPKFLKRVFNDTELESVYNKSDKSTSLAGYFAAKEAVAKSLGIGIKSIKWTDIEIKKDIHGKPYVKLHNNAEKIAYSKHICEILISISHSKENAIAQAIAI
ncbi:holo-ACP synthase [Serpentinicella alkaliphila]|uniref:Holo-[acyl-carrier-protein] synthase n=1 Tax=Serpentinicella alkaliphila TaxID=1734049 RepID=A0A4R2TRY8_9FIRM|nr:holo-ACP synthase [Serpentinicella alkaliphila]QUH25661.1 holo-ACP synthase [Serpentinicella alkaliphila]TCQ06628.1 holo-[acyl-carrier-protein] synthase [Serpentinicella alkaliphila]